MIEVLLGCSCRFCLGIRLLRCFLCGQILTGYIGLLALEHNDRPILIMGLDVFDHCPGTSVPNTAPVCEGSALTFSLGLAVVL